MGGLRMPEVRRIVIFPIKALDPLECEEVELLPSGPIAGDRRFALFDAQMRYVNGKRYPAVHRLRVRYSRDLRTAWFRIEGESTEHRFDLYEQRAALEDWLSSYFGFAVVVKEDAAFGFPDDREAPGPTVIATATLQEVGSWFGLDLNQARGRFRANLEIGDTEPFWKTVCMAGPIRWCGFASARWCWKGRIRANAAWFPVAIRGRVRRSRISWLALCAIEPKPCLSGRNDRGFRTHITGSWSTPDRWPTNLGAGCAWGIRWKFSANSPGNAGVVFNDRLVQRCIGVPLGRWSLVASSSRHTGQQLLRPGGLKATSGGRKATSVRAAPLDRGQWLFRPGGDGEPLPCRSK
jgi:hypothetical protein